MSDPTIPPTMPPAPPAPVDYAAGPLPVMTTDPNARTWGLIAHLSALVGVVIPFGNIVGPLVVWLIKKDEIPFAADQAKEALNFNITLTLALLVCFLLVFVLIGFILLPVVGIAGVVLTIIAAVRANGGEAYRYPMTLRLVK